MRSKQVIFFTFAITFLLFFTSIPTVHAFLYIDGGAYNKGARPVSAALVWQSRVVNFYVNTSQTAYSGSLSASVSSSEYLTAAQAAINAWAGACNANLIVQFVGTTSTLKSTSDNTNVIVWDNRTTGEGNIFGATTSTLAAAYSTFNGSNQLTDCDIVVNGNFNGTFGVNGESNKYDLVSTLTHEVGHCLGLEHPIEPPTYTSTNSYLTYSTMVQTAVAGIGTTYRRTINQDDIDGIECVYQRSKDFRSGTYCSNYHGTNGGAAISGSVSGGATEDRSVGCNSGDAAAGSFIAKTTGSSGCVTEAFAGNKPEINQNNKFNASWIIYPFFLILLYFIIKFFRKLMTLLSLTFFIFSFDSQVAQAAVFQLDAQYRFVKPELINKFADLGAVIGGWQDYNTKNPYDKVLSFDAAYGIQMADSDHFLFGIFASVIPNAKAEHVAKNPTNATVTNKTTNYLTATVGPFVRLSLGKDAFLPLYLAAGIGIGYRKLTQTIKGDSTSTMKATAIGSEMYAELGYEYSLFDSFNLVLAGGFMRERSAVFKVTEAQGTAYGGVKPDDRLNVTSNSETIELKSNFSGIYAKAGVSFYF